MIKNWKIGTDAEVFVRDLAGHAFPICGMVGGTKEEPRAIPHLGEGFAIQEDNAALEWNIPAADDPSDLAESVRKMKRFIETDLLPASLYPDYNMSSCTFDKAYLEIPQMNVFGCEPDMNAYTKMTNDRPKPKSPGFRSAAAHIHLSWDNPTDEERLELVRLSDVYCVLPGLKNENKTEQARRSMYGKAGAFRWKEYGMEHRVKSNRWVNDVWNTWDQYETMINAYNAGIRLDPEDYGKVQAAINGHHLKMAGALYKKYSDKYFSLLH